MNGHPDYKKILDEMWDLHCLKARHYGTKSDPLANLRESADIGVEPWRACVGEAKNAFFRVKNHCQFGHLPESNMEDALKDVAAFSMLALLFIREDLAEIEAASFDAELAELEQTQVRSGYRPPSEEIGNRMNEVLEKAK